MRLREGVDGGKVGDAEVNGDGDEGERSEGEETGGG